MKTDINDLKKKITGHGFSPDLAEAVATYMNTDYLANRMIGYLDNYHPRSEAELIDEMLSILEGRQTLINRHIDANRRKPVEELYLRSLEIDWDKEDEIDDYVKDIPAINAIEELKFEANITFFVGENGSGKSTLLEAIAVAEGLNPEGGTVNTRYHTYDDHSNLGLYLTMKHGPYKPKFKYFLRAESFFNVATANMTEYYDEGAFAAGKIIDYHSKSHGEGLLDYIQRADKPGLYLLDEPEAALSPQRQLTLLIHLMKMARQGAQFIISSHSPILLGIPDAQILTFDEGEIREIEYQETDSYQITKLFLENRDEMIRRLMKDEETE